MASDTLEDLAKSSLHAIWSDFDLAINLLFGMCDDKSLHNIALIYPLIEAISGRKIARTIMTRILSIRPDVPLSIRDLDFPLKIRESDEPDEPRQLHRFIPQEMITLYSLDNNEILAGQSSRKFKVYCGSFAFSYCARHQHIIIPNHSVHSMVWNMIWISLFHDFAVSCSREYLRNELQNLSLYNPHIVEKFAIFEESAKYGPWTDLRAIIGIDPIWKIVRIPLDRFDDIDKVYKLHENSGQRADERTEVRETQGVSSDEQYFRAQLQYSNRFMFVLPEQLSRNACVALIAQLNRAIMGCCALDIWHHNGDICCRIKCDAERESCALDCMRFVSYVGKYVPHINAPGMILYKANNAELYIPLSRNLPIFYYDIQSYVNEAQTYI